MKKKALFVAVVFVCVAVFVNAQKFYSDPRNGYSGAAMADYLGTTRTIDPVQQADTFRYNLSNGRSFRYLRPCTKLSNQESFLLWRALREYRLYNDEVYVVFILQGYMTLVVVVVITDARGGGCSWYDVGYFSNNF